MTLSVFRDSDVFLMCSFCINKLAVQQETANFAIAIIQLSTMMMMKRMLKVKYGCNVFDAMSVHVSRKDT